MSLGFCERSGAIWAENSILPWNLTESASEFPSSSTFARKPRFAEQSAAARVHLCSGYESATAHKMRANVDAFLSITPGLQLDMGGT